MAKRHVRAGRAGLRRIAPHRIAFGRVGAVCIQRVFQKVRLFAAVTEVAIQTTACQVIVGGVGHGAHERLRVTLHAQLRRRLS